MTHSRSSEVALNFIGHTDYYWNKLKLESRQIILFPICFFYNLWRASIASLEPFSASSPCSRPWEAELQGHSNKLPCLWIRIRFGFWWGLANGEHQQKICTKINTINQYIFSQMDLFDSRFRQLPPPLTPFDLWVIKSPSNDPFGFPVHTIFLISNPISKIFSDYIVSMCHIFLNRILTDTTSGEILKSW